ncbi:hypothetical protein LCGC14_0651550 [marine sediment metagenome]|uniref:Uncharacterized protein n=1 Tax=marine sediment metagenome TaxID=412755 RepID=A0A0F9U4K0_9ZZZZ
MIEVTVNERYRDFFVQVGDKLVGRVRAFNQSGWVNAYIFDESESGNYRYLSGEYKSLKQATNRVLQGAGFGNCQGISVRKVQGFRSQ